MNTSDSNTPKRLGKYQIIDKLAHGSMGTVYEAYDPIAERSVAIKVSRSHRIKDKQQARRFNELFIREAKTARLLDHPNIMKVFDSGVAQGKHYIVMELVKHARTIKDFISDEELLNSEEVLDLIIQCAKGLEYIHSKGIIHRDIKPANLLVTEDRVVKLADFSIAFVNQPDYEMTMSTGFVGSPRYMSPEQIQEDMISYRTDLYSLGVVMYELLTGKHPFASKIFSKLIYKVVNEDPPDPLEIKPDLPESLVKYMKHALNKDPDRRFGSASEMIKYLERVYPKNNNIDVLSEKEVDQKNEANNEFRLFKFFADFSNEELDMINKGSVRIEFEAGDKIISQERYEQGFYILLEGELSTSSVNVGESFGEVAFVSGEPYATSINAATNTIVLKLNKQLIDQFSETCQLKIYKALTKSLTKKLISTNLVSSVLSELS